MVKSDMPKHGASSNQQPITPEESLSLINQLFEDEIKDVHNKYLCQKSFCRDITDLEKTRLLPQKFKHDKLDTYWWLVYVEGQGMFCILCKKHQVKHKLNKRDVFVNMPSTRFLEDALKTHNTSSIHNSAIQTELAQKLSSFHSQICTKEQVEVSLYERVFWTVYFLMKNFISNRKLIPLLDFIETVYDYENLKYFQHKSAGSQRDFFITLGSTVKQMVIEKAKQAESFGLLTDEVSDISVTQHLISFIQFFDQKSGKMETSFLSCQNIMENFSSANTQAISELLLESVQGSGLDLKKLTGFASDGASVMVGKKGGVAKLLREKCPTLINVHCMCHKLALSCTDCNESIKYIKEVEQVLRQLWNFFDNSPKRMATYLKMQLQLKDLNLSKGASKNVTTRLKKACRMRWLSFDSAVKAVYNDYEALLQSLSLMQEDATALGLLKKMKNIKFLGVIYILKEVLPVLSELSRIFQSDSLSFSSVIPAVSATQEKQDRLVQEEIPLATLQSDIDSITSISAELSMPPRMFEQIKSLFVQYVLALKKNVGRRFGDMSEVVACFSIFDPLSIPNSGDLKNYGLNEVTQLAAHFYKGEKEEEMTQQLLGEWQGMKYHLRDVLRPKVPQEVIQRSGRSTSTAWCLVQLLSVPVYRQFFPKVTFIAEVAASLPVTNAWPERGASALKNLKTQQRNRLQNDMLEAVLHVTVNGPICDDAEEIVKTAVSSWLKQKERRKLAIRTDKVSETRDRKSKQCEAAVQTEEVVFIDQDEIRQEIHSVLKKLSLDEEYLSDV